MRSTAFLCLLLPALVFSTCMDPVTFPNGTATRFHHFDECGLDGSTVRVIDIRSAEGSLSYPLDTTQPIELLMPMSNSGKKIKKLLIDLVIYIWNESEENSGNCFWEQQETYGMTDDMDGCEMLNCPLPAGETPENRLSLDISYAASFIETGKPYQLVFKFKNGDNEVGAYDTVPVVGCTVFQTLMNGEE